MMFFDVLYNITIYPIEFVIETLFYLFRNVFKSSYGVSLFLLSLCINFLSLPLYNIAESWQAKERAIQDKMKPMIDNIKAVYKGDQRYLLIRACQRINGYKTIYAFRGTLGLLIQIPFFMAAYNFVHSLSGLNGIPFLFIKDLSKPDALIHIGSVSINLLPFVMTLFSLLAGFVYSKKLKFKESLPLYVVSLIFLVLLYNSPSALLFYWTINCLFSLVKNIVIEYKLYNVFVVNKYKLLKVYNIFFIIITVLFILLISLGRIERKAYLSDFIFMGDNNYVYSAKVKYYSKIFISSDIFEFECNVNKLTKYIKKIEFNGFNTKNAIVELNKDINSIKENIDIYYILSPKSYSINMYIFLLIFTFIININNVYRIIFKNKEDELSFTSIRDKLIITSCIVISTLGGLFIPTSLIGNSPQEFTDHFYLIFNNLSMSIGLFLFYPLFIYVLFSNKIKNIITLFLVFAVFIVLIDTFVMKGNYLNISSDFIFDNSNSLKSSLSQTILNILLMLLSFILLFLIIKNKKNATVINIFLIVIFSLVSVSIFNIVNIFKKEDNKLLEMQLQYKDVKYAFNLSKTGENIFVFILDRAINSYWIDGLERYPEYKKELDGFTIFPNTVSFGDFTIFIPPLLAGYEYMPYELSTNGTYNIIHKHNEAILMVPMSLDKYGYKSSILDPNYANWDILKKYTNTVNFFSSGDVNKDAISNYFNMVVDTDEIKKINQKYRMLRFSIFRMLPINLRYDFYRDGYWFFEYSDIKVNSSIYSYALLSNTKNIIKINEKGNYYNILHNLITHEPFYFNDDYLPSSNKNELPKIDLDVYKDDWSTRHFYANMSSMNLLIDFIKFLKENKVYDNTKIIVVSDHGRGLNTTVFTNENSQFIAWYNALLMYKDFNKRGVIEIDTNFMTIGDVPYLSVNHISGIKNYFTGNIITNDYKTNGVYIIEANKWSLENQFSNKYNFDNYYYVKDNIFNINNWKRLEMDWNTLGVKRILPIGERKVYQNNR